MAYIVMAHTSAKSSHIGYIVMAYIVMACTSVKPSHIGYIVMACTSVKPSHIGSANDSMSVSGREAPKPVEYLAPHPI